MKITDLLEAATPHNWKPIIQQPGGSAIVHLLMREGHDIPNEAAIQELTDKKIVDPQSIDNDFGFIYLMSGVPYSSNNLTLTRWYYAKLSEDGTNYDLYSMRPSGSNSSKKKYSASFTEMQDETRTPQQLQTLYISRSEHTWLISWPQEVRPNKQFDRRAAKATPNTAQQLAQRLDSMKLGIITQAVLQLKRSDPKAAQVIAAIKSAMSRKEPSIAVMRNHSTPVQLNIDTWWEERVSNILQNSLSTTRRTTTAGRLRPLDDPDFPKGIFAKLPEQLIQQIATWGKISQYSIPDNT